MLTPDKIIEIFVKVDDFCKELDFAIKKHRLETNAYKIRNREASLSDSEIMTILIAFHSGHFTNLKHFYLCHICSYYKPKLRNRKLKGIIKVGSLSPNAHKGMPSFFIQCYFKD